MFMKRSGIETSHCFLLDFNTVFIGMLQVSWTLSENEPVKVAAPVSAETDPQQTCPAENEIICTGVPVIN